VFKPYLSLEYHAQLKGVEHGRPSPCGELNILSFSDRLGYESAVCS